MAVRLPIVHAGDAARARACTVNTARRRAAAGPWPAIVYVLRCPSCGTLLGAFDRDQVTKLREVSGIAHKACGADIAEATVLRTRVLGEVSR
jgi:hypothetical protein